LVREHCNGERHFNELLLVKTPTTAKLAMPNVNTMFPVSGAVAAPVEALSHMDPMNAIRRESLTPEEKDLLLYIYRRRLRLILSVYPLLVGIAFLSGLKIDYRDKYGKLHVWNTKENGDGVISRNEMYVITISFLEAPLLASACVFYRRRIYPLRQDALTGVKDLKPYEIVGKSFFPTTGQYFIRFNDPEYLYEEVDVLFYGSCAVGDTAYVAIAPRSKYVFDASGKFTLL